MTNPPDPRAVAAIESARITSDPEQFLQAPLQRFLGDCPRADRDRLLSGIEAFHAQRMARAPSPATFPEAPPWVEHVRAVDRELQSLAGLSDRDLAIYRSLHAFVTFRGFRKAAGAAPGPGSEKCRVAYLPETDRGELHVKNVDDPATFWKRRPAPTSWARADLVWDGVGSGLHLDEEPREIFPLPVRQMCFASCSDVPSAVQFLTRYCAFWGAQNVVLYDTRKRSVAIEKCSYNFIEVVEPGPNGRSHVSGMVCRDPGSPQGRHQKAMRDSYRNLFDLPDQGPDAAFWTRCDEAERKLAGLLDTPGALEADQVFTLFTTPWPEGLNKNGTKYHPEQAVVEYTLLTIASLLEERRILWWQRNDRDLSWPQEPEEFRF